MRRWVVPAVALAASLAGAGPSHAATAAQSTCFWEGPISTERPSTRGFDGRDFNFPEESAIYWLARFHLPPGGKLTLRGRFAHARYQSLNAYSDGAPTDALPDFATTPDAGSTNPFIGGHRRDRRRRSYTVEVVNESPPASGRRPNTVYARPQTPDKPIELLYRVYEPDRGRDLTGGTGLPLQSEPCERINDADRSIPVQTVPAATWQAATRAPGCDPATNPAYDPPRWERFFNLEYATEAVITDCTEAGRRLRLSEPAPERGGFYSNRDNAYIFAHLSRRFGPLLVLRARMPTVPRTREGQRRMQARQVRFWSLCTGESRVTTRTPDCLADRQVPVTRARDFHIVVSRAADRPRNARARCGVGWLDWGERGDAAGRPDYGLLILRNMLPARSFAEAIQNVPRPGAERDVMGPYFPESSYSSRAAFEAQGCFATRLSLHGSRLRSGRRGAVRLRMKCRSRETRCSGRLALVRGRARIARGRFSIPNGRSRVVRLRLGRRGRAALRHGGRMRVRARARGVTPAGVALRATRRYTIIR